MRDRFVAGALAAALLLILAFGASFILGVLRPATRQGPLAGAEPSHPPVPELPPVARGRVEVLNGAGRAGLARQATEQLRSAGFDVVHFGNASAPRDSSEVLDRVGRTAIARAAADQLGIEQVRSAPDSTLLLDATVVLGKDWPRTPPAPGAATQRGWWSRIRGWLGAD